MMNAQASPRRVLVTGSATGLGLGFARAFTAAGDTVFLADILPEVTEAAKTLSVEAGRTMGASVIDLAEDGGADRLAAEAGGAMGGIDILINNAVVRRMA